MPRDSKGRFTANINQQVTDLGVAHTINGRIIDLTDDAMQRQTRLAVERKYEDRKIVNRAKVMMRMQLDPEYIYEHIEHMVLTSKYNDVLPAR